MALQALPEKGEPMSRLDEFLRLLCGRFDNTRQLEEVKRYIQKFKNED